MHFLQKLPCCLGLITWVSGIQGNFLGHPYPPPPLRSSALHTRRKGVCEGESVCVKNRKYLYTLQYRNIPLYIYVLQKMTGLHGCEERRYQIFTPYIYVQYTLHILHSQPLLVYFHHTVDLPHKPEAGEKSNGPCKFRNNK